MLLVKFIIIRLFLIVLKTISQSGYNLREIVHIFAFYNLIILLILTIINE